MADGKIFIGAQCVNAGLTDSIGSLDDAIQLAQSAKAGIKSISTTLQKGIKTMSENQFSHLNRQLIIIIWKKARVKARRFARNAKVSGFAFRIS